MHKVGCESFETLCVNLLSIQYSCRSERDVEKEHVKRKEGGEKKDKHVQVSGRAAF